MNHRTHWRNVTIVALSLAFPAWSAIAQQQEQDQQFDPLAEQQSEAQPAVSANSDVPSRVARLNYFDGTVTFQPAGGNEWAYAELNRPMTTGDQVWVDNGGRSELHIGSTALRLGQQTAVSIVNLDDQNAQLKLAQGTLNTRLRNLPAGQSFEVDTPNVALQADGPGSYRVEAAPDGTSTTVTVRDGSLTAYGDTGSVQIGAGQQLTFTGTNLQEAGGGTAPPPDAFEAWAVSRDRAEDASVSARYVSRDVPGYQDLDANGTWEASPDYGQVWVPRVAAGWAPYHEGHWAWVAPWGWTWVDDAPWGFAPFHYGRWAYYRNNWAWVPGPVVVTEPPCYAPALVAFVGGGNGGPGWGVSLTVGAVAAGVAWLPLGPGEPWRPAYHYSPRYYNRVNYVNHTTIVNNVHNTYINRGAPRAITGMPANQFVRGQGAGRYGQTLRPQQIARNSIGAGAPSIAPVRQSFGGGLRPANFRPPQRAGARPVIATRNAPTPFAYRDSLAQRFAKSGGRVQGAGQPVVRTAPPANFARIANAPGQPARGAAQPAFRVVPAERRPMPAQAQANRGGTPNGIPPNQVREGQQRGPQGPGQPQAQTGQRPGQFSGQPPGQAPGQTLGDLRPGQSQLQPGQRPGQTEADQRRDAQPIQGGVRPGQPARPGQQQVNPINGEHQPAQAGRPGEAPVQGQMPRENGVPHPPDRAQTGRAGEQPGNTPQRGERGQMQGQPQQEQQRGQQQAEQQRAQQNEQQRAQQAEQQRSQQQQGQQQAAQQRAQQAEQQRPQQQDAPQQAAQQQRAQQAEQQRSQQRQGQQQAAQQQRAQQADQQRSQQQEAQQQAAQQQRAQQAEQQRAQQQQAQQQAAQQQRTQQVEQQRSQQQEAQQQAAQQQRAQQAEQQRSQQQQAQQQAAQQQRAQQQQAQQQAAQQQRAQQAEQQRAQQQQAQQQAAQQQAAQQAQQRAQQQQAEQQQRQQAAAQQMQNQQRQQQMQMQQQQQQQRRAEPPHPGSARDSQRNDQQHG
jgi:hypothetical protein